MTVDPVRESQEILQRSAELTRRLEGVASAVVMEMDSTEVAREQTRSRELAAESRAAKRRAVEAIEKGRPLPPGVVLGIKQSIRRVPAGRSDYGDYMALDGREVFTPELAEYWTHQRDVLAPAVREMYTRAEVAAAETAPLRAAAKGHLSLLRQRGSFGDEGGAALAGALQRLEFHYHDLHQKTLEGRDIEHDATAMLANIDTLRFKGRLFERDPGAEMRQVDDEVLARMAAMTEEPVLSPVNRAEPPSIPEPVSSRK